MRVGWRGVGCYNEKMKTKWIHCGAIFASVLFLSPISVLADLIERNFVQKETGKVASGTVLQGSKNMRHFRSGRKKASSGLVVSPRISVSSLFAPREERSSKGEEAAEKRKPRFGFGAEERTESKNEAEENKTTRSSDAKKEDRPGVIYQFRYRYPVQREYYYRSPFLYSHGCSPFGNFFPGHGHRHGHSSAFRSISSSWFFGW